MTQTPVEQSKLILDALLGSPDFEAFGWRNHAGLVVDTQNQWWHGFGSDAKGTEVADGAPNLNFGRLNDPVINDLLDQARSETDPAKEKDLAQQINREFAKQCWIMPLYWTTWGIVMKPVGAERQPRRDARRHGLPARRRRVPGPGLARRGVCEVRGVIDGACATRPSD